MKIMSSHTFEDSEISVSIGELWNLWRLKGPCLDVGKRLRAPNIRSVSSKNGETLKGLHFTSSSCSSKEADNLYSFILNFNVPRSFFGFGS